MSPWQSYRRAIALRRPEGRLTTHSERYKLAAFISPLRLPLPQVIALFGSDKQREGEHSYAQAYADAFAPLRSKRIKLLEIGILKGHSLLAWRAYFPRASIAGLDIEPKPHIAGGRVRIYQGDQSSAADLDRVCMLEAPFDVIVDDGSHLNRHQLFTFYHLFPKLKDGGIYVIEDTQTSYWPGVVGGFGYDGCDPSQPEFKNTCVGEFMELAKYLNHAEFLVPARDARLEATAKQIRRIAFEHNLIIVWKGRNDHPSNLVRR